MTTEMFNSSSSDSFSSDSFSSGSDSGSTSSNSLPTEIQAAIKRPELSLVIPIYNESEQLSATLAALQPVLANAVESYELILVDDGSQDDTWARVKAAAASDARIKGLRFSRNFGKEAALCAGLDKAEGEAVLIMDADLQHPPRYIPEFITAWRNGFDVVEGVKSSRGSESLLHKLSVKTFYRLFSKLAKVDLADASDYKLLDRKVLLAWRELNERTTFFRGLVEWLGFSRAFVYFQVDPRSHGHSKWTPGSLIKLAITAITSFSTKPLHLVTSLGLIFLIAAVVMAVETLVNFLTGRALEGFTTVILLQLIIGGIITTSLGIIGIYIGKIYEEIKGRPRYILAASTAFSPENTAESPAKSPTNQPKSGAETEKCSEKYSDERK